MAVALDASTPAIVTGATSITTASFTAPAWSLLVALVPYNTTYSGYADRTITDSGTLTWTLHGRKSFNPASIGGASTDSGGVEIWWAVPATAASRTVNCAVAASSWDQSALSVKVFTDAATPSLGAITAGSGTGLPSLSVVTTATNSWVWSAASDWDVRGLGTAGSGQTLSTSDEWNGAAVNTHVWRQTATTGASGATVTNNLTAPASQSYNILTVEVKANAAPIIVQPPRRQ